MPPTGLATEVTVSVVAVGVVVVADEVDAGQDEVGVLGARDGVVGGDRGVVGVQVMSTVTWPSSVPPLPSSTV